MRRQHDENEVCRQTSECQLADYLERLSAPLVPSVPYEERERIRHEMRNHIDQLTAAHMELGSPPDEATESALRQFGSPDFIGAHLAKEIGGRSYLPLRDRLTRVIPHLVGGIAGGFGVHAASAHLASIGATTYSGDFHVNFTFGLVFGMLAGLWRIRGRNGVSESAARGAVTFGGLITCWMAVATVAFTSGSPSKIAESLSLLQAAIIPFMLAGAAAGTARAFMQQVINRFNLQPLTE